MRQQQATHIVEVAYGFSSSVCPPFCRAFNKKGEVLKVKGYVEATDLSQPGQLTLHLDGVPDIFGAPYWIVALGDEDGVGLFGPTL